MRARLFPAILLTWVVAAVFWLGAGGKCAQADEVKLEVQAAADLKLEVQLLWGTNDKTSPDPKHKPVDAQVEKKLKQLPLKWSHYFVVKSVRFEVPHGGVKRVALSEKCEWEVRDLGNSKVEVTHFGKGQQVWKGAQALPKGETLVLGGNAPNETAWLAVLKRIE